MMMSPTVRTTRKVEIENCYFSVELKTQVIEDLKVGLIESFRLLGVLCEEASSTAHVSLAYGQGKAHLEDIETLAHEIAKKNFQFRADHFEVLEGLSTPFDYLVLSLDPGRDFSDALDIVENKITIRHFVGGFKSHVSLIRFPKGSVDKTIIASLVRELNASQGAAVALGRILCLEGDCVCVFNPEKQCFLQVEVNKADQVA